MPIKRWILRGMNRMHGVAGRPDLERGRRERGPAATQGAHREPSIGPVREGRDGVPGAEHLGAYAPLVDAIRAELGHFVSAHLRLHLAIAERDRYLLTSIDVEPAQGSEGGELLRRFLAEFTPEQIKRFLARELIAHLPNASAIDLAQFGGLNAERASDESREDDDYAELVAQLRSSAGSEPARAFDVTLRGRWTEADPGASKPGATDAQASPRTPLAGTRIEIEIEDADGTRRMTLSSAVPNRRYAIGTGEACDIPVNGRYASRRHCEIWLENGAWWAADAGSTNGIRVESARSVIGRGGGQARAALANAAIEIVPGARIVLSALAQGSAQEYPRVLLKQPSAAAVTPLAPAIASPATPATPIAAAPPPREATLTLTVTMAGGTRTVRLGDAWPLTIGRSRNQALVVDWAHEGVSGHHVDIVRADGDAVEVEVHGDNGVVVRDVEHGPGDRFRWRAGEPMMLGRGSSEEPRCVLLLSSEG